MTIAGTLRPVLGDQISDGRLSSLSDLDPARDVVLFAEVRAEASYVPHHRQKIALIFAGMRGFAERLRAAGVRVRYVRLDDPANTHTIAGEIARAAAAEGLRHVVITEPGEWRLKEALDALAQDPALQLDVREDDRFLCSHATFRNWARGKKALRMEHFYRHMRQRTGLLMDGPEPCGGRWNFDSENRKRLPKSVHAPARRFSVPNAVARQALDDVARWFPDGFGSIERFSYPTEPQDAERLLAFFLDNILPGFGDYQDAMARGEPWLWHSILSTSINLGLLDPMDVCRRAEARYRDGSAPLNAVEGFVRQILGWREFVRGVYWLRMPDYKKRNVLNADRRLPWFYWSGETDMACIRDVVTTTRDNAYAHHIQRLMVTGNFAMLLGVHPDPINEWYLAVYADAYEWVELPNTHGMATFADGGIVGSKPYAATGAYINRMSDYCGTCRYDVKKRIGDDACPFNALYWDFLDRNRKTLAGNIRMAMPYKSLERMSASDREDIRVQAETWRERSGATPL
jgi:deoxyribodipyrimidine photolyase-related protein